MVSSTRNSYGRKVDTHTTFYSKIMLTLDPIQIHRRKISGDQRNREREREIEKRTQRK